MLKPVKFLLLPALFLFLQPLLYAQGQLVRGRIVDSETLYPLEGATVILFRDSSTVVGSLWCETEEFRFENVPLGKISVRVNLLGYKSRLLSNLVVGSAKEVVLEIPLETLNVELREVEIKAKRDGSVNHEMAPVSAREFSVEETDRYAGSRGDPARMASNFAGVQGADDSRNDIVIRGNSPQSVLW